MEDYKKKYEEALEKCKKEFNFSNLAYSHEEIKQRLERIFPELKEREDEKSKEWILECLYDGLRKSDEQFKNHYKTAISWLENQGKKKHSVPTSVDKMMIRIIEDAICTNEAQELVKTKYGLELNDLADWLEMQRELKPSDNVKSKFKVGDWIVANNNESRIFRVESIFKNFATISDNFGYQCINNFILNEQHRLWTIKDVKDGDVLTTHLSPEGDWIGIYKESFDILGFKTYCFLNGVGEFVINPNRCRNHGTHGLHPATKEQQDLLFQKMKEAGYEWDVEKKELKKIEQKSNWSEEDEEILNSIIEDVTPYGECPDYPTDEEREYFYGGDRKVNWLKSIKDKLKGE